MEKGATIMKKVNRGRLDLDKNIASSLIKKYGAEKAKEVAYNKSIGAMTESDELYWCQIVGEIVAIIESQRPY